MAFVDLTKAFDLINRCKLWEIVSDTGIKGKLYENLLAMFTSVKTCVRTSDGLTDIFSCTIGLKQGCFSFTDTLFSITINEFVKEVENSGLRASQVFPDLVEILLIYLLMIKH